MKIYTRTGDSGKTGLSTGERVLKCSQRLEAYGTVDELNSFVGLLRDQLDAMLKGSSNKILNEKLLRVQNSLFDLGSELSTPSEQVEQMGLRLVEKLEVAELEAEMDEWDEELKPLKSFILPGGHVLNSYAHVCRTVCRRAERMVIQLAQEIEVRDTSISYLNRLSDWFFVLSRLLSCRLSVSEVEWNNKR